MDSGITPKHSRHYERKQKMAAQAEDTKTQQIFNDEEKTIIASALKTHAEKVARKASADAPKTIRELWEAELKKIEEIARKVLK